MSDIVFKLRILLYDLQDSIRICLWSWRREVWERDLDAYYCCDGRECGCNGSSIREIYTYRIKEN